MQRCQNGHLHSSNLILSARLNTTAAGIGLSSSHRPNPRTSASTLFYTGVVDSGRSNLFESYALIARFRVRLVTWTKDSRSVSRGQGRWLRGSMQEAMISRTGCSNTYRYQFDSVVRLAESHKHPSCLTCCIATIAIPGRGHAAGLVEEMPKPPVDTSEETACRQ